MLERHFISIEQRSKQKELSGNNGGDRGAATLKMQPLAMKNLAKHSHLLFLAIQFKSIFLCFCFTVRIITHYRVYQTYD